jgi:7-carboxy-7-deazaguanine synthase
MTIQEVLQALSLHDIQRVRRLVISGGEPMLQQRMLDPLLHMLKPQGIQVEIETNGTVKPEFSSELVSQFNVSPKLNNSGNDVFERYNYEALCWFKVCGRAAFKFVATSVDDLREIADIVHSCHLPPDRVYVMPEGKDPNAINEHAQQLASEVIRYGWNLTTRLHVLLYGNRRGV